MNKQIEKRYTYYEELCKECIHFDVCRIKPYLYTSSSKIENDLKFRFGIAFQIMITCDNFEKKKKEGEVKTCNQSE